MGTREEPRWTTTLPSSPSTPTWRRPIPANPGRSPSPRARCPAATTAVAQPATAKIVLGAGGMGAYTTFSTFTSETLRLAEEGAVNEAIRNATASFLVGLAAASTGIALSAL